MKAIIFEVSNTFFEKVLFTAQIPYDRERASYGTYSNLWKRMRETEANSQKCDKHFIRLKFRFARTPNDRTVMTFASGVKLDMPSIFEMTKTDWKILELHLEAKRLSLD